MSSPHVDQLELDAKSPVMQYIDRISTPSPPIVKVTDYYYLSRKLKRTCSIDDNKVEKKLRTMPSMEARESPVPTNDDSFSLTPQPPPPPVNSKARRRTCAHEEEIHERSSELSRFQYEFEPLTVLGGGTFGTVYKCKARLDGCLYAVKVTNQKFKGKADRERALKEVYALAAVCNNEDNPYIVRYFSAWTEDERLYIQTELCDNSLQNILLSARNNTSETEKIALSMVRQILHALSRLHRQNIVHLDIKPANIFIKNGAYKLGDLGHACLARIQNGNDYDKTVEVNPLEDDELSWMENRPQAIFDDQIDEGDSRYMSKELLEENYTCLPKSDIFSLGITIYEIGLMEELPGNGDSWCRIREGQLGYIDDPSSKIFSDSLKELVRLMMHPDPKRRPSAETLLASGGPKGILRSEVEVQLARERAAADDYRKQLARMKSHGTMTSTENYDSVPMNRMKRSNTL